MARRKYQAAYNEPEPVKPKEEMLCGEYTYDGNCIVSQYKVPGYLDKRQKISIPLPFLFLSRPSRNEAWEVEKRANLTRTSSFISNGEFEAIVLNDLDDVVDSGLRMYSAGYCLLHSVLANTY